jgi:hypothetical protein
VAPDAVTGLRLFDEARDRGFFERLDIAAKARAQGREERRERRRGGGARHRGYDHDSTCVT